MRVYLVNVDYGVLPKRAWQLMTQQGIQVTGNWSDPPYKQELVEFAPDVIVYAPHRQKAALSWRDAALNLPLELVKKVPTILWALYPDYLTGWDHERNEHAKGPLEPVQHMLPYFRASLANSRFTKELLKARAPGFTPAVCYPAIDTAGIDHRVALRQRGPRAHTVLWQHRWATDKNLPGALEIVLELAPKHPDVTFYLGRKENWDEAFWSPQWLKDLYAAKSPELEPLSNVRYSRHFPTREEYWDFISSVDIAFSCSYHETFGIAMLEQAYAGAACVVPNSVAYPEVHAGTLVVEPSRVAEGISSLLQDAAQWTQVAASSRANAAKYTVEQTVKTLLPFVMQVEKAN